MFAIADVRQQWLPRMTDPWPAHAARGGRDFHHPLGQRGPTRFADIPRRFTGPCQRQSNGEGHVHRARGFGSRRRFGDRSCHREFARGQGVRAGCGLSIRAGAPTPLRAGLASCSRRGPAPEGQHADRHPAGARAGRHHPRQRHGAGRRGRLLQGGRPATAAVEVEDYFAASRRSPRPRCGPSSARATWTTCCPTGRSSTRAWS